MCALGERRISRSGTGGRDRRLIDSQDGGDQASATTLPGSSASASWSLVLRWFPLCSPLPINNGCAISPAFRQRSSQRSAANASHENLLITHRGLSGPAILQISSYWRAGDAVQLDLAPQQRLTAALDSSTSRRDLKALRAHLRTILPQRLADRMLELEPPAAWSNHALESWEKRWHSWRITPETTEGYAKAEVTAGGVDTAELSAKTMESHVRGLFFIGEVVDVTGHLGGFNFQWAWASGAAAGRAV